MDADLKLELFRIKFRASIVEALTLKLHMLLGVSASLKDRKLLQQSIQATLLVLEEAGTHAEQTFLSDPEIKEHEAMRALYADECREVVDKMKSRVNTLGKLILKAQEGIGK